MNLIKNKFSFNTIETKNYLALKPFLKKIVNEKNINNHNSLYILCCVR